MKNKKLILSGIGFIAVVILGAVIYQWNRGLDVETAFTERLNFEEYYYEEGQVQSQEGIRVFSPGKGQVVDVLVKEGDQVKRGDLIISMDNDDLAYQLSILKAERKSLLEQNDYDFNLQTKAVELLKGKMETLKSELEKNKVLLENGAISQVDYEKLEQNYKDGMVQLDIESMKLENLKEVGKIDLQIRQIENQIQKMKVVSPIDGIISDFSLEKGERLLENQMLFEVFNPDFYEIETYVQAKEIRSLQVGMTAFIEYENQHKTEKIRAAITSIAPRAVEIISTLGLVENKVKIILAAEEEADFIQGEKVDVKLITYHKDNAQTLSRDYVFPWKDGEAIWIIDEEGKASIKIIHKAYESATTVVLEEEIDEKIAIIIPPYPQKLNEGVRVR